MKKLIKPIIVFVLIMTLWTVLGIILNDWLETLHVAWVAGYGFCFGWTGMTVMGLFDE